MSSVTNPAARRPPARRIRKMQKRTAFKGIIIYVRRDLII
jgi:hypothetical protein